MDYRDIYKNWLASGALTADEKAELSAISDDLNAQKDRFGAELEFGTAGMRGVLGAGINRMNAYTVARATKGLARYIIGRGEDAMRRGVVVSYDTRRFSIRTAAIVQELANCSTFDDASSSISATLSRIWCSNSWICICKDFMESSLVNDSIDDIEDNCPVHRHGYCDTMKCIARYADKKPQSETEFPTSEMLPDFYEMSDKSKVILYTPIHIRDNTLGYLAFNFYPWSSMNYLLNYLTMAMSQLLESVRRQNELYAYAKKIDMLYITDPLTSLYNRRGFFRIYNDYAEDGVKDDCMVISVDLDNLKLINDNFGHNEGDNAILTMANALKSAADENDICARFGGDEYVVFGKGKGEYEMNAYIDKVNKYLSEYNLTSKKPYNVHGSFGGCILPKGSKLHIDYYINKADSKMYVEKESHKRTRMLHDYSKDKPQTDE